MRKKVIIIGGVAGGATAAARLRRLSEDIEITMYERGPDISFANCGLPYHIGDVIPERDQLLLQTPQAFYDRYRVNVKVLHEVRSINPTAKKVEVYDIEKNETFQDSYDELILSPGAIPLRPPIPGIESHKIFTLRNVPDTDMIKQYVHDHKVKRAVIVGAGFIGLEVAENLHDLGVKVAVVEMQNQVMAPLDYDMAAIVHQHLKMKNIKLHLSDGVKEFIDTTEHEIKVVLGSGKSISADMVVLSIGIRPELKLAQDAGLRCGRGIDVDSFMRTSDSAIYAVGDAIEFEHPQLKMKTMLPLAGPANKQARIAANNICGIPEAFQGAIGTSIVKIFDLTVAATGLNEKTLKANDLPYEVSFTHNSCHAGYYPGASPVSVKLIFHPESGKIWGAQIVGMEGVDKRIDLFSVYVQNEMTIYDLERFEQAYAPPYNSAKDIVNYAGFVAANIINKKVSIIHWHQLDLLDPDTSILLDVRDPEEVLLGTIENGVNIPLNELRDRLDELDKEKLIVVYCQVGLRGYLACRILSHHGFQTKNLSGGYKTYAVINVSQSNEDVYEYDVIDTKDEIRTVAPDESHAPIVNIDACGLQCPGPVIRLSKGIKDLLDGQLLSIQVTDAGFANDVKAWCNQTNNRLVKLTQEDKTFTAYIQKGLGHEVQAKNECPKNKTIVVFSDKMDRLMAALVIANGAAAMGRKVTLFFTFWGLNVLRKEKTVKAKKDFISRMFGKMMPKGHNELPLSQMNFGGIGKMMMRLVMEKKQAPTLDELLESAKENGIRLIACQMTMEIMGIQQEELIDGVEFGGVATYLEESENSNMNLFI